MHPQEGAFGPGAAQAVIDVEAILDRGNLGDRFCGGADCKTREIQCLKHGSIP